MRICTNTNVIKLANAPIILIIDVVSIFYIIFKENKYILAVITDFFSLVIIYIKMHRSKAFHNNPDHLHKHYKNIDTLEPERPIASYPTPYRLILQSRERDSGTIDNASFFVDMKDTDIMTSSSPYVMCVEAFAYQNTTAPTGLANKFYYIRMGNLARQFCQNKTTPKDVLQTVYGNSYFNTIPQTGSLGTMVLNKTFFQNRMINIYFTNNLDAYTSRVLRVLHLASSLGWLLGKATSMPLKARMSEVCHISCEVQSQKVLEVPTISWNDHESIRVPITTQHIIWAF